MRILALDLGARLGWAVANDGDIEESGMYPLDGNRPERLAELASFLRGFFPGDMDAVVYERPFCRGLDATRSSWGAAGVVEAICSPHAAVLDVHNSTIKAWAGGAGKGKAPTLAKAKQILGRRPTDDNHADAVCIAIWACETVEIE